MKHNFSITREFLTDLHQLSPAIRNRADTTIDRMLVDPWAAELHPEKVKSAESGVHSSRVDDNYRIIWKHIKPAEIVFCLVDKHEEAYRRASRKSFTLENGVLKVVDITQIGALTASGYGGLFATNRTDNYGELFIGYRDNEILGWGVPDDLLPNVRALNNVNQLESLERLLEPEVYNHLLEIALDLVERPVVPDEKLRASLEENQGGDDLCRFVTTEEFQRALQGSMEDWMLFLAPMQRSLVTRSYNGPARIKGVSGSGKTVVALHRVKILAQRAYQSGEGVLVLTYGNRLPEVMMHLIHQLLGDGAPELGVIKCTTIHKWCYRFLLYCGRDPNVVQSVIDEVLTSSVDKVRKKEGKNSNIAKHLPEFFAEEIRYSIKGRDIRSEEDYLQLERTGRGTRLTQEDRRYVWKVYQAYQEGLTEHGACDYDDFILNSLDCINQGMLNRTYRYAVVDEIQDLTEATMKLVRSLVTSGSDDLFLVGDGLQRIYPGGYSLSRLRIDITGRGTILRRNYRNTQQILQAAHAMIEDIDVDDLDDEMSKVEVPEFSVRQGEMPVLVGFQTVDQELAWVSSEIERMIKQKGYKDRDIAILYRSSKPYELKILEILGIKYPITALTKDAYTYFGSGIKTSSFHSAKGLEFKVVFVVGVTDGLLVPKDDGTLEDKELDEFLLCEQRLLYVAMTRARDLLYVTYSRGQPSRFLNKIPAKFLKRTLIRQ